MQNMKYIVANWKSHKNRAQVALWIDAFAHHVEQDNSLLTALKAKKLKIVIAPPAPFLIDLHDVLLRRIPVELATQQISAYPQGSYTGEVAAASVSDLVSYTLVGHSERRSHFHDDAASVQRQAREALEEGITPILCVSDAKQYIKDIAIVAYEPLGAIGTGANASVSDVVHVAKSCHLPDNGAFLYGGSVTSTNAKEYLCEQQISGVLVGGASLDATEMYMICTQALPCL